MCRGSVWLGVRRVPVACPLGWSFVWAIIWRVHLNHHCLPLSTSSFSPDPSPAVLISSAGLISTQFSGLPADSGFQTHHSPRPASHVNCGYLSPLDPLEPWSISPTYSSLCSMCLNISQSPGFPWHLFIVSVNIQASLRWLLLYIYKPCK